MNEANLRRLYDSYHMSFWKKKNYGGNKKISDCQGLGMHTKSLQSCLTLRNLIDCSPLCSSAMGFSRKDTGVDYHALLQGDLPQPEIKSMSLMSPVLAGKFCTTSATWEALRVGQRRMNGQSSDLYSSRNIMISICHYTFVQGHGICTTPRVNP